MKSFKTGFTITVCIVMVILIIMCLYLLTPAFTALKGEVQKTVDKVDYDTQKLVEDTCRAMISSYKSDVITYETYIDSEDEEEQSWAKQAKIRANKTAVSYNEYILKNSFVWEDNIPDDINAELEIIE